MSQADVPEDGWYWVPEEPGFGITLDVQQVGFNDSGLALFGAVYTYDQSGQAVWYTFQGDVSVNENVYAWREGHGTMASFQSVLTSSQGGNCLHCPHSPPTSVDSDLGEIHIEWNTPVEMTVTINDQSKTYHHFSYHSGLGLNTLNHLEHSVWMVRAVQPFDDDTSQHDEGPQYLYYKGAVEFSRLSRAQVEKIDFDQVIAPDFDKEWYVSSQQLTQYSTYFSEVVGQTTSMSQVSLLLAYDSENNKTTAYIAQGDGTENNEGFIYQVNLCGGKGSSFFDGVVRPTTATQSVLYYAQEANLPVLCQPLAYSEHQKRTSFLSLERQTNIGLQLLDVPFFQGDFTPESN